MLGLATATALAVRASQQVTQQRDILISGLLISQSKRLGHANPALSRLLSVAAWRINPSSAARHAMLAAAARPGIIAVLTSDGGAVTSVAFSTDGRTLATGNADGTTRLWDMASHRQIAALTGPTGPVDSVAFSPDGRTLATGNTDGTARLWDMATRRQIAALTGPTGAVSSVAFSPDGKTLATGGADATVRLWDVATHRQSGSLLTGPTAPVSSVAFSPDGATLASWQRQWRLVVGRAHPCNCLTSPTSAARLTGHAGAVNSVAFSPDGKTLAAGSGDGTVQLWDMATQQQIATLTRHHGTVTSVAFSPDGTTLAAAAATAPSSCGTWPPTGRSPPSPAPPALSPRWRSARTARPWPAARRPHRPAVGCRLPRERGTAPVRIGRAVLDPRRVGTIRARPGLPEGLPVTAKSPAAPTYALGMA